MDTWKLSDEEVEPHQPRILRTDEGANRVILLRLPAGELLQDHEVRERALVFISEGKAIVRCGPVEERLEAPALLHFGPSERHEVQAETDVLLTLCLAPWPGGGFHDSDV